MAHHITDTVQNIPIKEDYIFHKSVSLKLKRIDDFESDKLVMNIKANYGFDIRVVYSFDEEPLQNWSYAPSVDVFNDIITQRREYCKKNKLPFFVFIQLHLNKIDETEWSYSQIRQNTSGFVSQIHITGLHYKGENLFETLEIEEKADIVNRFPTWNIHNNQQTTIERWLNECVAVNNRVGHQVLYFKTEPEKDDISNTLNTINQRNVVAIKKMIVSSPDNEIPTDRNVFSEWDIPMVDDFIIHIPVSLFQLVFGNEVPSQKDFMYLPILNKLYTINSIQPGQKYMGVTGWWECFLSKYEADENINHSLDDVLANVNKQLGLHNLDTDDMDSVYKHFEGMLDDGLVTPNKEKEETIEEKKEYTENFKNKVVDSMHYVDLKETELQRELYNKKLGIVTLSPLKNAFPVNLYNLSTVNKGELALSYNLKDATSVNKHSTIIEKKFFISFNIILEKRFTSTLFDVCCADIPILSVSLKGYKLMVENLETQEEFEIDYKINPEIFYQINIVEGGLSIDTLIKGKKETIHRTNFNFEIPTPKKLNVIRVYGGEYKMGQFLFELDKRIIFDKVQPILKMNNFATI